jgi:hypothetical protein
MENAHYKVHRSPLVALAMRQINPGNTFPLYVFKIHFNITLQFTPRYSKWSPPFTVSNQNSMHFTHAQMHKHECACAHAHHIL